MVNRSFETLNDSPISADDTTNKTVRLSGPQNVKEICFISHSGDSWTFDQLALPEQDFISTFFHALLPGERFCIQVYKGNRYIVHTIHH